jgi:uncharacterized membrane protein
MKAERLSKLLPLGGLIVLAGVLRLLAIDRDSLWFDEALSSLTARLPLTAILSNTVESSHPPLYYAFLHLWRLFGPETDGFLRLGSALWGVLLVPLLYFLALAWGRSLGEARFAAFLVAVSPFQVLYSHELRMYTLLMVLVTAMVWVYVWARPQTGYAGWFLFATLGAAALYTHLFAIMPLLAIGLYALIRYRERRAMWRTIGAGFIVGVLFLPWLRVMLMEQQQGLGSMRPLLQTFDFNPILPLTTPTFLLFGLSGNLIYSGVALFLTLALAVIVLMDGRKAWREGTAHGLLLPALVAGVTLILPLTLYLIRPFFLPERTLAAAAPFLLLFLAWGTTRRGSPLPYLAWGAAALMVIGTIIYLVGGAQKPPYREVMAAVADGYEPGDAVLHTSDGSYLPALHYITWPDHALLAGDPDPRKAVAVYEAFGGEVWAMDEVAAASGRLWLVVALEHSEDWQIEQVDRFRSRFHLLETQNVGGIVIYLFDLTRTPQ